MSAEWKEVKRVLEEVLDLPEEDREVYLAGISDEDLRRRAEALLSPPNPGDR